MLFCIFQFNQAAGRMRLKFRDEFSYLNDSTDIWWRAFKMANIFIFQIVFPQWRAVLLTNNFEMFFLDWSVLSSWKISGLTVQPFTFFGQKCYIFQHIWGKNISLKNIYGFTQVQKTIIIFGPKMSKSKAFTFKDLFNSLLLSIAA